MDEETKGRFQSFLSQLDSETFRRWKRMGVTGLKGSSRAYLLSRWREKVNGPLLVIAPRLREAELIFDDLRFFQRDKKKNALLFPPWETLPYDEIPPHPEIVRERMKCLLSLIQGEETVILSSVRALMQKVLSPSDLKESIFPLLVGEEVDRDRLTHFLLEGGFTQTKVVEERGDFSLRGAIIDIFSPKDEEPLRLEFEGDRLVSLRQFDKGTQRSIQASEMKEALLLPARDISKDPTGQPMASLLDYLRRESRVFVMEEEEMEREAEAFHHLIRTHYEKALGRKNPVPSPDSLYLGPEDLLPSIGRFHTVFLQEGPLAPPRCEYVYPCRMESNEDFQLEVKAGLSREVHLHESSPLCVLQAYLRKWKGEGMRILVVSHTLTQAERMRDLLSSYEVESHLEREKDFSEAIVQGEKRLTLLIGLLSSGFRNPSEGWMLLTEEEIFGERRRFREEKARERTSKREGVLLSSYSELRENDHVVHTDYGVGLYRGLRHLRIGGISNDYLLLEYLDGDKLYVPVDRLNLIQRYIGAERGHPKPDRLGGRSWQRAKKRAKAAVTEMVKEILDLYAVRQAFQGVSFSPVDQSYKEFEATFEYEETPDQMKAIDEVMEDMNRPRPTDRLICGDVGFGKTEVALRASYRAVMDGKQVALLVPTTVLAQQHHQTFCHRFKNYPVVIEMLSRFKKPSEQKEILKRLREGRVDIVIGTHRLLQKDVVFHDLGLVIIDEEHRFGVIHKERLKQMKRLVDAITLTATPIPRTLQMAVSGIRDLSLIQTPPEHRLSIQTFVVRYDEEVIREALEREFARGGQAFFVHHRIQNIYSVAGHLKRLLPEAHLAVAHGQMRERELEKVMLQFVRGEYNLLVCTSIIESGLDIPTANTILINHAEQFGLADLYQLRGRVGRGSHQAYAYLLIPSDFTLSREATQRLRAIQELSELGSGFRLALQDLEIRGAGNLLGSSQSGHISAVGLELYTQLMEKAVRELKGEEVTEEITPEIHFRLPAFIPESYVEDPSERLNLYRRLSFSRSDETVEEIGEELEDRFGSVPEEVAHLLEMIKVKILLTKLAIKKLEETPSQMILTFHESTHVSPRKVIEWVRRGEGRYRLTPDSKLIIERWPEMKKDPLGTTKKLLQALA